MEVEGSGGCDLLKALHAPPSRISALVLIRRRLEGSKGRRVLLSLSSFHAVNVGGGLGRDWVWDLDWRGGWMNPMEDGSALISYVYCLRATSCLLLKQLGALGSLL